MGNSPGLVLGSPDRDPNGSCLGAVPGATPRTPRQSLWGSGREDPHPEASDKPREELRPSLLPPSPGSQLEAPTAPLGLSGRKSGFLPKTCLKTYV